MVSPSGGGATVRGELSLDIAVDDSAQSEPLVQRSPVAQRLQPDEPPQSTPVSSPFMTPSEHVGRSQTLARWLHTPESQSEPTRHAASGAHGAQSAPPPSTQVSLPSRTPLSHEGGAEHTPDRHVPLAQSSSASHAAPT